MDFLLNNPQWVGVFSGALFAMVTVGVIAWQVCVMKSQVRVMVWQARSSYRHESIQNRLIQSQNNLFGLQLEHERVQILNAERSLLLKLGRKLQIAAGCLKETPSIADALNWEDVRNTMYELHDRLRVLDVDAYDGAYDKWFFHLKAYVDAVSDAVIHDGDSSQVSRERASIQDDSMPSGESVPTKETVQALHDAKERLNPIGIFLEIEAAIRMEFFEFKEKWEAETGQKFVAGAGSPIQQSALTDDGNRNSYDTKNQADELAREFRAAEKWVIGTNMVLSVVGVIALWIYHGQLEVMRGQLGEIIKQYPELQKSADSAKESADVTEKSFNLAKRREEDSDEAICNIGGGVLENSDVEHISISNSGRVSAHAISAHIEISRTKLPTNQRLSLFGAFDVSQDELRLGTPILKDIVLREFGKKDWEEILQLREAIVVSGTMQYENGFGDVRHVTFCQAYLAQPPNPGDFPQTPHNVMVDCDRLPTYLPPLYETLKKQERH